MLRLSYFIFLILPFCNSTQTPSYETILCYVHDAVKVNPAGGMFELKPEGFESCKWQGSVQLHEELTKNLKTYYEYCSEHNMTESAKSISDLLDILHVCELN